MLYQINIFITLCIKGESVLWGILLALVRKVLYKYCLERCYGRKVTTPTNIEMANMNRLIPIVFPSLNL